MFDQVDQLDGTPWKRLEDIFAGRLEDVLKTSWRRLQNILKTPWRGLEDVLKTSWRCLEDVRLRRTYSKTSSEDENERRLQNVFIKTNVCWVVHRTKRLSSLNLPVQSLKKTDNRHYLHHQRHADVFIVKLKELPTLVLVIVVALWNLLLCIKTLH